VDQRLVRHAFLGRARLNALKIAFGYGDGNALALRADISTRGGLPCGLLFLEIIHGNPLAALCALDQLALFLVGDICKLRFHSSLRDILLSRADLDTLSSETESHPPQQTVRPRRNRQSEQSIAADGRSVSCSDDRAPRPDCLCRSHLLAGRSRIHSVSQARRSCPDSRSGSSVFNIYSIFSRHKYGNLTVFVILNGCIFNRLP